MGQFPTRATNTSGQEKFATFDQYPAISKTVQDRDVTLEG